MHVSYSMVRGLYSDVSSTAPRQCGGYQIELTHEAQHPFPRKVMSGAVNSALQLMGFWNLNVNIRMVGIMPQKESPKSADKRKWCFHFRAQGALTWIQVVSIPKLPTTP